MDKESIPFWTAEQKLRTYSPLKEDITCDVCIVGAGIAGLTTAYLLSKEGKKVVILDDGPVAGGQTMRTTAHLSNALDDRYYDLERLFGKKGSETAAQSHLAAINLVASLVKEHEIDCDFERVEAYLFAASGKPTDELTKEFHAAKRAGVDVKMVERCPLSSFDTGPAIRFGAQAQFHPLKFIKKLCELLELQGVEIFCGTHVTQIKKENYVETDQKCSVKATHVVVATNSFIHSRFFPHLKLAAYRTYVIAGKIPQGYVPAAFYYDTLDPYHYIRIAKDSLGNDILIIGGGDHRTGEEEHIYQRYVELEAWARHRFPKLGEVTYRWSGQILEPVDSLGFIGRAEKELYMVTGDSGNGLTHGVLGRILINDLIHGRKSPWEEVYDPHRISLKATADFLEENLNTAWQYSDWLVHENKTSVNNHCGKVVSEGLGKCAIYKDEQGKEHKMSAICPHLKAIVHWNEAEHCWECPAHGSRFNALGEILQGPANSNLKKI